jgi:hypothetical protein
MTSGPFVNGILLLAPDESRVVTWGQFGGLMKALGSDPVHITCIYWHRGRRMPPAHATLEVDSYDATDASESETGRAIKKLADISSSLNRLRESIERIGAGDDDSDGGAEASQDSDSLVS